MMRPYALLRHFTCKSIFQDVVLHEEKDERYMYIYFSCIKKKNSSVMIYNHEQKGWDEFAFTMFAYARDTSIVRANDKCPFPDPHPFTMLSLSNRQRLM